MQSARSRTSAVRSQGGKCSGTTGRDWSITHRRGRDWSITHRRGRTQGIDHLLNHSSEFRTARLPQANHQYKILLRAFRRASPHWAVPGFYFFFFGLFQTNVFGVCSLQNSFRTPKCLKPGKGIEPSQLTTTPTTQPPESRPEAPPQVQQQLFTESFGFDR